QASLLAEITSAIPETRLADTGRTMLADEAAVLILAEDIVEEEVLCGDDVAFHADYFSDMGHTARAIAQPRHLDDDIDRGNHHLADGARRQLEAAHGDHRFQTRKRLARAIGVERAHRAVVAGIHRL